MGPTVKSVRKAGHTLLATYLGVACIGVVSSCQYEANVEEQTVVRQDSRPNIIFLLADDQRAATFSIENHPVLQTPNLDRLAAEGIRFENAFTVEPICAPSRFAFFSGQYERTSGLGFNSPYQVSQEQWDRTYPAILREAGYHTGFIGKFGIEYYDLSGGAKGQFDFWHAHDGWLPFFPKPVEENPATHIYRDADSDITTEIMGEAIKAFLTTRPAEQPFSLSVSFSAPHNSIVSSMFPDGADPGCESKQCEVMGFPANGNPVLKNHPVYDELYRDVDIRISDDVGSNPYRFIPEGVIDHEKRKFWYSYNYDRTTEPEHLIRYYQTITGIDRVIGDMVEQLEAQGIADNTIIIYTSDHGLLNGEYGTGGKGLLYDLVAKIPLIIFDPRTSLKDDKHVDHRLVLSTDVPATIIRYAGATPPDSMQGSDLNSDKDIDGRSEIFLESLTVAEGNPFIEAIRTHDRKYVRYLGAKGCPYIEEHLDFSNAPPIFEQFFDLKDDPDERRNLVGDQRYETELNQFRDRIAARSNELTRVSRQYKNKIGVQHRPDDRQHCW